MRPLSDHRAAFLRSLSALPLHNKRGPGFYELRINKNSCSNGRQTGEQPHATSACDDFHSPCNTATFWLDAFNLKGGHRND